MRFLSCLILAALVAGCGGESPQTSGETTPPAALAPLPAGVPVFNADSAFAFTKKQVEFGPRVPNSAAHQACAAWLESTLKRFGATVQTQDFQQMAFDGKQLQLRNVIAQVHPKATRRILLAAHWDTRPFADKDPTRKNAPFDGANDGAGPVGQLLEIVRLLADSATANPGVGLDVVLFDGEDYGYDESTQSELTNMLAGRGQDSWCLGSQYWAKNRLPTGPKPVFGVLLDMSAATGARFSREEQSRTYANEPLQRLWALGQRLGYGAFFLNQDSPGITDDHVYMNQAGIPTLDIIDHVPYGQDYFPAYHHATADNLTLIDRTTLKAVGQTLLTMLFVEGQGGVAGL